MSKMYSDPTASAAIGSLDKELERMKKTAKELREKRRAGVLTPELQQRARMRFPTGMVRRLFDTAMDAPEGLDEQTAG